jgi:hypothetical protein
MEAMPGKWPQREAKLQRLKAVLWGGLFYPALYHQCR